VKSILALLARLVHVGVDPAKPRQETKHIVLTNAFAAIFALNMALATVAGSGPPFARVFAGTGAVVVSATVLLNRFGMPFAASAWLLASSTAIMVLVGLLEPEAAQHAPFLILAAAISWFVFPPSKRAASTVATVLEVAAWAGLRWAQGHFPAVMPEGYDLEKIATGNRTLFFAQIIAVCIYAAREMARVERELVAEREKTRTVLEQEVGHQVAERSRELGRALARGESSALSLVLSKGDRFHTRYRVVRPLGEGGMGAVYEVERLTDAARLALKVVTGTGTNAARFAREAEIGARVHHANLVSIVDVGVAEGGAPFLVMELVKGGSLEDRRARFGDVAWALPILRQVVEGLLALHDAAVVHRDLKPANVLLSGTEGALVAKISDFGISRFGPPTLGGPIDPRAATVAASPTPEASHLTSTGAMLGTPLYMAPEAAKGGRTVEASADVFAFGILAYEAITGRFPFAMPPVLLALAGQALPLVAPMGTVGLDGGVRDCVLACLSEDAAARPSARRLKEALGP
jgi:Protein kinase domain